MIKQFILAAGLLAVLAPLAASADEVLARDAYEHHRIDRAVQEGRITPWQGHRLNDELARVRAERRHDERRQGGHLTTWQFQRLNAQESNIARQAHFEVNHDRF